MAKGSQPTQTDSPRNLAREFNMSEEVARRWARDGIVPAWKDASGEWQIDREAFRRECERRGMVERSALTDEHRLAREMLHDAAESHRGGWVSVPWDLRVAVARRDANGSSSGMANFNELVFMPFWALVLSFSGLLSRVTRAFGLPMKDHNITAQTVDWLFAWVSALPNGSSISASDWTTALAVLSPHRGGFLTRVSRQLTIVSGLPLVDTILLSMARSAAAELERVVLVGLGASYQPAGISVHPDLISVPLGAGTLDKAHWLAMRDAIDPRRFDGPNKRGAMLVTTPKVRTTQQLTADVGGGGSVWTDDDRVAGYPAGISPHLPTGTDNDGHTAIFGAFEDVVLATFGPALDTIIDPYVGKNEGMIEVCSWIYADVAVVRGDSFAITSDIDLSE